jgi:hypothetical protein
VHDSRCMRLHDGHRQVARAAYPLAAGRSSWRYSWMPRWTCRKSQRNEGGGYGQRLPAPKSGRRLVGHPANGTTMISTCLRTAKLSVASSRPMRRRSVRRGCGHSLSGTTKVVAQRTAMPKRARRRWLLSRKVGAESSLDYDLSVLPDSSGK